MFRSLRYIAGLIKENYIHRKRISNLQRENQALKNELDLLHNDINVIYKQCNHEESYTSSHIKGFDERILFISKHVDKVHDYLTLLINK